MKNNIKKEKLDLVYLIGIIIIGIVAGASDGLNSLENSEGMFPVYSCTSILISYIFNIIILIFYCSKNKNNYQKTKFLSLVLTPFLHLIFVMFGWMITGIIF